MKRGEIWTAAAGGTYSRKPRPIVILQDDRFQYTASVTVCGFTSDPAEATLFRPLIQPTSDNGLIAASRAMIHKINTMPRSRLGKPIGRLGDAEMADVESAIYVFLGLAS